MIGKSIKAALTGSTAVSAIISTRCYPIVLPQNPTLPAVVYQVISRVDEADSTEKLLRWRVQIGCHAKTYDAAHDLASKAISALEAYNNKGAPFGAFAAINENLSDDYDSDLNEYRVLFDALVYSKE